MVIVHLLSGISILYLNSMYTANSQMFMVIFQEYLS